MSPRSFATLPNCLSAIGLPSAGLLIESLEADPEPDIEAAWSDEVKRRVADLDAGNVETIPWEEVRRRLLDRLNAR
jgi:putative addiction module component (TIGR02574 family)